MSSCLQGWRSWSNQPAALHHGQQGPEESPSDEQVVILGWAVISIKSLGSDPRLLSRVPSRHSLSREPPSASQHGTVITHIGSVGGLGALDGDSQQSAAKEVTHSPQKSKAMWAGAPALTQALLGVSQIGRWCKSTPFQMLFAFLIQVSPEQCSSWPPDVSKAGRQKGPITASHIHAPLWPRHLDSRLGSDWAAQ